MPPKLRAGEVSLKPDRNSSLPIRRSPGASVLTWTASS